MAIVPLLPVIAVCLLLVQSEWSAYSMTVYCIGLRFGALGRLKMYYITQYPI